MGRITTRDLLKTARRELEVVVADRPQALRALDGLDVETTRVDVTDPASLRRALRGAFATIASLPYRFNLEAMNGALAAGAHYVDLGGLFHMTRRQLTLSRAFERAELMAILGVGSAPGILNVLAVRAAEGLDRVREIHCMVGAVDRTRLEGEPPPLGFSYSPDTLLDEFELESAVFRAGRLRLVPALDPRERVLVRFPAPIGAQTLDTTLHSEVATLPGSFAARGVREVTFRQGFEDGFADRLRLVASLGLIGTTPLPGAGVAPRQVLLELLRQRPAPKVVGKPDKHEVLRVVVRGQEGRGRAARAREVTADCYAGPRAGWGIGPDIDTGAPPSIAVQLLASGELPLRPGVWAPEQVVPVAPFVRELERRGMRVRVRVRDVRSR
jgi:saccharopine dehydrogenase (NAD+, L-lysine-forming)